MPRSPVPTLPYSDVYDQILAAFDYQLSHFFYKREIKVVPLTNGNALSEIVKTTNQAKTEFPFFSRQYNSIDEIQDQRNTFLLRLDGLAKKDKAGNWFIFRLTPLRTTLTLNFLCVDEQDLKLFVQRWYDCYKLHFLDYSVEFNDNPLKIRVDCDPSITYPEQDENSDTGQNFNCQVTCSIVGYMGSITPQATIQKVTTNTYTQGRYDKGANQTLKTRIFQVEKDGLYSDGERIVEKSS